MYDAESARMKLSSRSKVGDKVQGHNDKGVGAHVCTLPQPGLLLHSGGVDKVAGSYLRRYICTAGATTRHQTQHQKCDASAAAAKLHNAHKAKKTMSQFNYTFIAGHEKFFKMYRRR